MEGSERLTGVRRLRESEFESMWAPSELLHHVAIELGSLSQAGKTFDCTASDIRRSLPEMESESLREGTSVGCPVPMVLQISISMNSQFNPFRAI